MSSYSYKLAFWMINETNFRWTICDTAIYERYSVRMEPDRKFADRFTDLAQILHVNLVRGSNHEMDTFRLK